ncbi:MAG: class I SAM-dependent methyltransferase [Chloroflexi bacterium]|nr:class I SAM-dependent methyltransferase [Chloroflexota bacterium]
MAAARSESARDKLRRRGGPALAAFLVWLGWSIVAAYLLDRWPEWGMRIALIALGGLTCSGFVILLLFLRREFWRQRRHDLESLQRHRDELERQIWLSSRVSPRLPMPLWNGHEARRDLLNAAWDIIRSERPKHVLELGSGLSTLVMAYALEANGTGMLQALENQPETAASTRRLLSAHKLQPYALLLEAPLRQVNVGGERYDWYCLPDYRSLTPIDLLFVDGPEGALATMSRYPALPILRDCLAHNAAILVDDIHREDENLMLNRWLEAFPNLERDENFESEEFAVLRFVGGPSR